MVRIGSTFFSADVLKFAEVRAVLSQLCNIGVLGLFWCCVPQFVESSTLGTLLAVLLWTLYRHQCLVSSGLQRVPLWRVCLSKQPVMALARVQDVTCPHSWCALRSGSGASDRVAVITGASRGIGFHNAFDLARLGFQVVLCCRSQSAAESVVSTIRREIPNAVLHIVLVDMESLESVRQAASAVTALVPRIDVLVNNAGMFSPVLSQRCEHARGCERLVAVNYVSLVLFTELLVPLIVPKTGRIVNVSSIAHLWAKGPRSTVQLVPQLRQCLSGVKIRWNTYGFTKLLVISYTRELSQRLAPNGITVVSLHPGAVLTDIFRELGVVAKLMPFAVSSIFKTPEEGAETTLWAATTTGNELHSGSFYADCRLMDAATSPLTHCAATNTALSAEVLGWLDA